MPDSLAASGTPVSSTGWSSIVSGFSVGGLLGCAAATQLCLLFGRKTVLLLNNVFVILSSLLFLFGASWDAFFGARVLIGVAAGIATGVVPLYLSEICPSSTRAAVGTAHQLGIASGLLLSQLLTSPELCPLGRLGLGLRLANPNPNPNLVRPIRRPREHRPFVAQDADVGLQEDPLRVETWADDDGGTFRGRQKRRGDRAVGSTWLRLTVDDEALTVGSTWLRQTVDDKARCWAVRDRAVRQ